jgi:hypothetical protein
MASCSPVVGGEKLIVISLSPSTSCQCPPTVNCWEALESVNTSEFEFVSSLLSRAIDTCAAAAFSFRKRKVPVPLLLALTEGKVKTVVPLTLTGATGSTVRPAPITDPAARRNVPTHLAIG